MKTRKLYFGILFFGLSTASLPLQAQSVIDSTDFPEAGTVRYRITDTIPSTTLEIFPEGGTDLVWDFGSAIEVDKIDTINYLSTDGGDLPFSFVYPDANYAVQVLPEQNVIYLNNSSESHFWYGIGNPLFPVPFSPGREFLKFPMEYEDTDVSSYGSDLQLPFDITLSGGDSSLIRNNTTETFVYDAYGNFIDPIGNTVPCLRRSHYTISEDSAFAYIGGVKTFIFNTIDTTQGFSWFGESNGVLANVNIDTDGNTVFAEIFSNIHPSLLSVSEESSANFKLYPNPSSGVVYLEINEEVSGIEVYNMNGQVVFSSSIKQGQSIIDLQSLDPGVYLYRILKNQNQITTGKINLRP